MLIVGGKHRENRFIWNALKWLWETVITVSVLGIMLSPGIALDIVYKNRISCGLCGKLIEFLKKFAISGITYQNAFRIIESNVGVLMTLVSFFLSLNVNIAERSEKKIYGIPRRDLELGKKMPVYKWVKRMSYLAPLWMLFFVNIQYCVSGYLVFFYSYLFLFLHYFLYENSFSQDKNREAVINRLLAYIPVSGQWSSNILVNCYLQLNAIANSIEGDCWQDVEVIGLELFKCIPREGTVNLYIMSNQFTQVIYYTGGNSNTDFRMHFLKEFLTEFDSEAEKKGIEAEWPLWWGVLKCVIEKSSEAELIDFLETYLDYSVRSRLQISKFGKELNITIMQKQTVLLLVLIEYRLRVHGLEQQRLKELIDSLWHQGKAEFLKDDNDDWTDVVQLEKEAISSDGGGWEDIIEDMVSDCQNNTQKSMIANILC